MRRAGHSWSNRQKTQKSDHTVASRIGKALLLAFVCAGFLLYTIPRMHTGAYFTATASSPIDFEMTVGGRFANDAALPDAQLKGVASTIPESGAPESKAESKTESASQSSAASTAESTVESTAPQSKTESSETQSTPTQDRDTEKSDTDSTNADAPGNTSETGDSVQSGTES